MNENTNEDKSLIEFQKILEYIKTKYKWNYDVKQKLIDDLNMFQYVAILSMHTSLFLLFLNILNKDDHKYVNTDMKKFSVKI